MACYNDYTPIKRLTRDKTIKVEFVLGIPDWVNDNVRMLMSELEVVK